MISFKYQVCDEDGVPVGVAYVHSFPRPQTSWMSADDVVSMLEDRTKYAVDIQAYACDSDGNYSMMSDNTLKRIPIFWKDFNGTLGVLFRRKKTKAVDPFVAPLASSSSSSSSSSFSAPSTSSSSAAAFVPKSTSNYVPNVVCASALDAFEQRNGGESFVGQTVDSVCEMLHWPKSRAAKAIVSQRVLTLGYERNKEGIITCKSLKIPPVDAEVKKSNDEADEEEEEEDTTSEEDDDEEGNNNNMEVETGKPEKLKGLIKYTDSALVAYMYKNGKDVFDNMTMKQICAKVNWSYTAQVTSMIGRALKKVGRNTQRAKGGGRYVMRPNAVELATHSRDDKDSETEDEAPTGSSSSSSSSSSSTPTSRPKVFREQHIKSFVKEHGDGVVLGHTVEQVQTALHWAVCRNSKKVLLRYMEARGWRIDSRSRLIVWKSKSSSSSLSSSAAASHPETSSSSQKRKLEHEKLKASVEAASANASDVPQSAYDTILRHVAQQGLQSFVNRTPDEAVVRLKWVLSDASRTMVTRALSSFGLELDGKNNRFKRCDVVTNNQLTFVCERADGILCLTRAENDSFANPLGPSLKLVHELSAKIDKTMLHNLQLRDESTRVCAKEAQQSFFAVKEWMSMLSAAQGMGADALDYDKDAFCNSYNTSVWMERKPRAKMQELKAKADALQQQQQLDFIPMPPFPSLDVLPPSSSSKKLRTH
jgi:hypothetical protein